ncbi:MAG: sensor histidine kinase [Bacteroidales bacterium]|nr:sensor histidine kinase [Bacteroidales bacterium]
MKTGNKISLIITAGAALILLALMLVLYLIHAETELWMLIVFPSALFVLGFFPVRELINIIIRRRITPLHHTLHGISPAEGLVRKGSPDNDILSEVEEEVMDWARKKKTELDKLKSLETYRKEFLGNVYHELKTPIFNIQGYILTLMEGGLEDPEINRLYLERTEQNINRLISIVDDLESISGLESGALNLKPEVFNIRKTVMEVFEANEIRARKQNIRLETGKVKDSSITVKADKRFIFQVLNNLVMNSINYGVKNGITTVNIKPAGSKVYVEVNDNGIGISSEDLHRIFERFYRVDKSRSRDTGGTGLGLSIVKHIIEAHKQTIQVKSVPGEGSSFTFTLDRA